MFKVTTIAHTGRFGQHTSTEVLGVYKTRPEAEAAAANTGLECRILPCRLTPTEAARALSLAAFGVEYTPAHVENNSGWGKSAPVIEVDSKLIKEDRTAKLLALNSAALAGELVKRKPDQDEVARLRKNIATLEVVA